jgi:hypothetical protein
MKINFIEPTTDGVDRERECKFSLDLLGCSELLLLCERDYHLICAIVSATRATTSLLVSQGMFFLPSMNPQ